METDGVQVVREIELSATADEVWAALTDPTQVRSWFGSDVAWDLRPGGAARFTGDDGDERVGEVDEVDAGRSLRFRWWPAGTDGAIAAAGERTPGDVSAVRYELEPVDGGTRLVVTETRLGASPPAATASALGSASTSGIVSAWDVRLVSLWLCRRAGAAVPA